MDTLLIKIGMTTFPEVERLSGHYAKARPSARLIVKTHGRCYHHGHYILFSLCKTSNVTRHALLKALSPWVFGDTILEVFV